MKTQKKIKAKKKYNIDSVFCRYCKERLTGHSRCSRCHILLHSKDDKYKGVQHTLVSEINHHYCKQCYDNF